MIDYYSEKFEDLCDQTIGLKGFAFDIFKFEDYPFTTIDKERPCYQGFYFRVLVWNRLHVFKVRTKFLGYLRHDKFKRNY